MGDTNMLRLVIADQLDRQATDIIGSPSLSVGLVINREINSAIRHYESKRFRWNEVREEFLAATVSGTRTYTLPPSLIRMDTLKIEFNAIEMVLNPIPWEEMEMRSREATAQGVPTEYTIYGNVARLYPVPNAALSLHASYIRRIAPTSLTASYTAFTLMGGRSLTTTTTASHNNREDGWTTDGEELIRARATAAVEVNYLKNETARLEMAQLLQNDQPFLSLLERLAFQSLKPERDEIYSLDATIPPVKTNE